MAQITTTMRNTHLTSIKTTMDTGGANTGKLFCYSGTVPGIGVAITSQTLLYELTGVTLATASGGAMTFTATADSSANAGGTPTFYRLVTSADAAVVEGTAGVSSGELTHGGNTISLGGTVSLSSATLTAGSA
jgi:hypothetical protein